MPRVLIIEDDHALAAALAVAARRLGAEPAVSASGQGGLEKAGRAAFDAVLLDIGLPDMSGLRVLETLKARGCSAPVLVITAHGTLDHALEARRLGAHEYFLKPLNLADLQSCLRALLKPDKPQQPAPAAPRPLMIGSAPAMQRAFAVVAQACATREPVLITGAPGTGKTLAAEVIARHSADSSPLKIFRCDEWPDGKARAAFHEALAGEGPLLIEEAASLPLPLQGDLSAALQENTRRILATTSADLPVKIAAGLFREDLHYQLGVLRLRLPPLSARTEDVPALASYLLASASPGRDMLVDPAAMSLLKGHDWPGNVRELAGAMRHASAVCAGTVILPHHLPESVASARAAGGAVLEENLRQALTAWLDQRLTAGGESTPDYDTLLADIEHWMLSELLERHEGRPTHLAAALRMNRATLRKKLRELPGAD
ncbi:MAG TPA: response regulator [Prosthecobacter sp.]|nr:response regulator [Prosthecobacter sp.]HRK12958.1 response regulator [Prosthecobacter sp.]